MKKIIIPIGALLITGMIKAQVELPSGLIGVTNENYIYTRTYLEPKAQSDANAKQIQSVQYFDGLGRAKQAVNIKASPLGMDVVTPIEYDPFGRQVKDYLPIPQTGTQGGMIISNPQGNASVIYGGEKIFSEKVLENSPLDRIQQQIQVGNDWSNKPVTFKYETNVAGEVKKFVAKAAWSNSTTSSAITPTIVDFPANQLYKNTITDEDGNETIEFKNGEGQILLVRKVLSATENADTYYVYNDFNQLAFVITPMGVNAINALAPGTVIPNNILTTMCYLYRYDSKGRLALKKNPHKGWEYFVYDKADRVIMTQDVIMGVAKQWLFTKYDDFGRPAYTGIYTSDQANGPAGREIEQNRADALARNSVKRISSVGFTDVSGMPVYYDNTPSSYPSSGIKVMSINYYDTYPAGMPAFTNLFSQVPLYDNPSDERTTKGFQTASFVKNIEDDKWTKNYTYYDIKGRQIGSLIQNHLGGQTDTQLELDFSGVIKRSHIQHQRTASEAGIIVQERFVYDNQNRLNQHFHQVDNLPEELLTENTYNELSQLTNKKVGNGVQSMDYAYNIRGWMTDINKSQMTAPDLGGKLFAYKIKYSQKQGITNPDTALFAGKNVEARFNGNIAEVDWRAVETLGANPSLTPKRYGYVYDKLNRLTAGYYQNPLNANSKEHTESIDYDINGNITNLYRTSVQRSEETAPVLIDKLVYTYTGNQVTKVDDLSQNSSGYEGGGKTISYTANGSMVNLLDKGINSIRYNRLELPNVVTINQSSNNEQVTINILYGADGVKLRKINNTVINGVAGPTTTKYTTDYLGGFQYMKKEFTSPGGGSSEMFASNSETAHAMEREAYSLDQRMGPPIEIPRQKNEDLQFFPTSEGYFDYVKDQYIYQYKDHLGNVRVSFGRNSAGALEITDANDYYPFGMNHLRTGNSYFVPNSYKNYKYNGKELQETGMYDYGARFYMSDIGRWGVVDPLAEKMPSWSPYVYTFNNPIIYTDPDGREPFNEYDKNGKMISNLGGNKIDFYHQRNGDTKVVSRETGASNIIRDGESIIRGYTHRGKDVGWGTITAEYFGGSGPARSLFSDFNDSNHGPFASLDKASSPYSSLARQDALNSKNSKGGIKMDYLSANPLNANFDGYEQMWGRSNVSWYKLGDETLFLMTDSKSQESLFYRLPVKNFERTEGKVNSFGNTYQTYIWTESNSEVQKKVINPTLKSVFKQSITPPSILTRP